MQIAEASIDPENLGLSVWWWAVYLECPEILDGIGLDGAENFFSKPVKHFGRGDIWGAGVDDAAAGEEAREDEDDLDGLQADAAAVDVAVLDCQDEADAAVVFGDICRKVDQLNFSDNDGVDPIAAADGPPNAGAEAEAASNSKELHNTPTRLLYKRCCEATKHFNAELTQSAQDRKFRFQQQKMFHSYGKDTDNLTKWEFYSDDDDVLLWVEGDYILANIEEIVEMRQAPTDKTTLTRGNALRSGTGRDRVAMKYAPNRVAMLLRLYQEANPAGKILESYQNQTMSYWHLPRMTTNPLDY